jgi:hypothetical protein
MAPSSSFCMSLFSNFEEMLCASGDKHKWRRKCKELEKDTEAMVLLHLLVAQDDDLKDKLMKRSRVKLSHSIIGLFTRLCAYGEMNVELKNLLCLANLVMPCVLKMRSYNMKLVVSISMLKPLEEHATILILKMMN